VPCPGRRKALGPDHGDGVHIPALGAALVRTALRGSGPPDRRRCVPNRLGVTQTGDNQKNNSTGAPKTVPCIVCIDAVHVDFR
jgi:hypothetical protein